MVPRPERVDREPVPDRRGLPASSTEVNEVDWNYTAILFRVRVRAPDGRGVRGRLPAHADAPVRWGRLWKLDPSSLPLYIRWWRSEFVRMFDMFTELGDVPILVGGDFNAGTDATELAAVRDSGQFRSAFDEAGLGWGYTRPAAWPWARIDHILASPSWTLTSCWVGPSFGSDH